MKVHITARHLSLTPAISAYITKKINRLERHFDHLVWASVILSVEKHRHIAEMVIHSPLHTMRAKAEVKDLYSAIDLAMDKMDKQVRKLKDKWQDAHRFRRHSDRALMVRSLAGPAMLPAMEAVDLEGRGRFLESQSLPSVISVVKQVPVKPSSVEQAVQTMESLGYNFWMFLNRNTKRLNVVFRRSDQTYGLLEPGGKGKNKERQ